MSSRRRQPAGAQAAGQAELLDPAVLTRIGDLELVARRVVEGFLTGLHRSTMRGFSTEFDQFRPYAQGDDLKHVDWKVFARTDRFFVKEFEADRNLDTQLLVDASGSMSFEGAGPTKARYAAMLAASLAYLLLRQKDRVGLTLMGPAPQALPALCRPGHLQRILAGLENLEPSGEAGLGAALEAVIARGCRRGLVVLISDLYDEPESIRNGLALLRHAGHEVLVFHLMDRDETEFPFRGALEFVDLETGRTLALDADEARRSYLQQMGRFLEAMPELCAAAGASYFRLDTATSLVAPLAACLSSRSAGQRAGLPWR